MNEMRKSELSETKSNVSALQEERLVSRADLCKTLDVHSETIRKWLKSGKLPTPDVALSRKTLMWRLSTLRAAGINLV